MSANQSAPVALYALFCKLLREARVNAGLSQEDVAKRLNRPQSYVSKDESGEHRLDVIEFLRVAKVLRIVPDDVLMRLS
ncbi:MAG TPA: helix-turn-helix transcriptional regulator [Nitrospiraceae bacterium]|nr:helix-turn-helix transcriptional regulator [Nitrospiraceae bacterium]